MYIHPDFSGNNIAIDTEKSLPILIGTTLLHRQDLIELSGAPNHAQIHINQNAPDCCILSVSHDFFAQKSIRFIICEDDEISLYLYNLQLELKPEHQKRLLATFAFLQQVNAAFRLGFSKIKLEAAGDCRDEQYNGYYTWARLGFTMPLSDDFRLPDNALHAKEVADLMQNENHIAWWKENGQGGEMEFDLHKNSKSFKVLEYYLESKGILSCLQL
ncbi:hypothetical protein [Alysiella filiformis]|uniref:Uncharacterized protein n=1 Tax=Alysiella filiformis DSM 16848 TaxID=1120981 RepID=A0A286EFM9_9NEIS|nr:hypothetical protein [Alysiella filiformis]QMT30500.1 hypothetical protein H3L97_06980 [Alysiella filiformis]UBQ56519.1 hypothetical protein JF568_01700 [Alysiella filiformis DSM 16848]SOD69735.1 hypothetical protein SAMN02746062_01812 [Alysiella filiformis DSM 16848]